MNIYKNVINLVTLESHGPVEYYIGKYFEKRIIKAEKMDVKIFNCLCKISCRLQILITKTLILFDHENMVDDFFRKKEGFASNHINIVVI